MARSNRKRSKERRPQPGVATANARTPDEEEAPPPLEHMASNVDLAEAQLAVGRPEEGRVDESELEREEAATESGVPETVAAEVAEGRAEDLAKREPLVTRLVQFLQGSWRELQRVQWPDRRQVMQATGVVIGFVIVAGAYLALADGLSQKIVNLILK